MTNESYPIVIVGAARTPMGGFQGALKPVAAPALGSVAIAAALERASVAPGDIGGLGLARRSLRCWNGAAILRFHQ